jgi:hypothetical protein
VKARILSCFLQRREHIWRSSLAKYTAPYDIRAKMILLATRGLDYETIGQRLDLPRQIVFKLRKGFHLERLGGLEDRDRTGRPSGFSP